MAWGMGWYGTYSSSYFYFMLNCLCQLFLFLALHLHQAGAFALPSPLRCLRSRLKMSTSSDPVLRIGHGWDIHRLVEGRPLVIGGVTVPHTMGSDAHR